MSEFALAREQMVAEQLKARKIRDPRVLAAFGRTLRHEFVLDRYRHQAYDDNALPIEAGQTISQPYVAALMTQLLGLKSGERVLEIGTGSGYQAAILAEIAAQVYTIERHEILAESAASRLERLGYRNVFVVSGDGSRGLPEQAPFEAVLITAAAPLVAQALLRQLVDGGRLVLPVGDSGGQKLQLWVRQGQNFMHRTVTSVSFVPLRGELGWNTERWP